MPKFECPECGVDLEEVGIVEWDKVWEEYDIKILPGGKFEYGSVLDSIPVGEMNEVVCCSCGEVIAHAPSELGLEEE